MTKPAKDCHIQVNRKTDVEGEESSERVTD